MPAKMSIFVLHVWLSCLYLVMNFIDESPKTLAKQSGHLWWLSTLKVCSTCYKFYNSLFLRVNSLGVYFPLMQCVLQAAGTRLWAVPPPPRVRVCLLPGTQGSLQRRAEAPWCSGTWQSLPCSGKEPWNLLTHGEFSLESCPRPKTVFFFSVSLTSKLKKSV